MSTFTVIVLSILTASFVLGSFSSSVSAESVSSGSSDVTVRVKDIITLRILDSSVSSEIDNLTLSLTPTPNGTFTKGSFNVDASTSNATGYKLYMTSIGTNPVSNTSSSSSSSSSDSSSSPNSSSSSSSSNSSTATYTTDLINIDNTISDSIPTLAIDSSVTEADFRVRNSSYKNKWGYSLASLDITDTSSITYTNIPSHGTNHEVGGSNSAVESDLAPITIGVNVSNSVASGTYKNALEFTAIANPIPADFNLSFNGNSDGAGGETGVINIPSTMTASTLASSYTFTLPDPEDNSNATMREDYMFAGWNTEKDGTGDTYATGEEFTIIMDDTDPHSTDKTLYATWKPLPDFWKITYMQDMTSSICNSVYTPTNATELTEPKAVMIDKIAAMAGKYTATSDNTSPNVAQGTFYDARDNKPYTVRKLADSNCWMVDNLALELSTSKSYDVVVNATGELYGTKWTPDSCGTDGTCAMNGNTRQGEGDKSGFWYYSWYAATAGSGTYNMTNLADSVRSICPKGWRLPPSNNITAFLNKTYVRLANSYGITAVNSDDNVGAYILSAGPISIDTDTGYYYHGILMYVDRGILWQSTTQVEYQRAFSVLIGIEPPYTRLEEALFQKALGVQVRCVAM